jgi:hypothetical protein
MNDSPTETGAVEKKEEKDSQKPKARRGSVLAATLPLYLLVTISLILNAVVIRQLILVRVGAQRAIEDTILLLEDFKKQTFSYTFVVDDTLLIDSDLPVDETIPVRIQDTIPINTTVVVPVDTRFFGIIDLQVPIRTSVPVDIQAEVNINQTFRVNTTVPIYVEVPVAITVAETPLFDAIGDVQAGLDQLSRNIGTGLLPTP